MRKLVFNKFPKSKYSNNFTYYGFSIYSSLSNKILKYSYYLLWLMHSKIQIKLYYWLPSYTLAVSLVGNLLYVYYNTIDTLKKKIESSEKKAKKIE